MNPFRRQLPVRSPLPFGAALAALSAGDPRERVSALLREDFPDRRAFLTNSGTSALSLAIQLAQQRKAGPIALPAFGCFDLATGALGAGASVRLYDVVPHTLQPDLDSLADALGNDGAAVVIVHHFGMPVALEEIRALLRDRGAALIEDAAQGSGARIGATPVGRFGDLSILSFGRGKGWTGGGGGALLVTEEWASAAEDAWRAIGESDASTLILAIKNVAQWSLARPGLYSLPSAIPALRLGETVYHAPSAPTRMATATARTLLNTRAATVQEIAIRRAQAERLDRALARVAPNAHIAPVHGTTPGWLRLPVLIPEGTPPSRHEAATLGILPSYPISLADLPELKSQLLTTPVLAGARALAARLWTVPTHGALTGHDLDRIERWMASALTESRAR